MYWVRCAAANCCSWLIGRTLLFHHDSRASETLLARLGSVFAGHPERGAVARAMLLGDRSFVDSSVVLAYQKTAAYHVLVVAGLHVGALVIFCGRWGSACGFRCSRSA
jgi:predicted membrane metal-binding protein